MFPQLCLDRSALERNVRTMAKWCADSDLLLAPHVKTTMCRPIFDRQAAAGAVGATVATIEQASVVLGWGEKRIFITNQIVDAEGLSAIRLWQEEDPEVSVAILVDSVVGVEVAESVFAGCPFPLEVLVDVGAGGRRTGVRDASEARRVATAVARSTGLRLVGVAGYEGVVPNSRSAASLRLVDGHCELVRSIYLDVATRFETSRPIFSMGGSAFPDRAAAYMPTDADVAGTRRILRSGCYVTHDHGTYDVVSPIEGLVAALRLRTVVLSAPEPGLAVLAGGKRDVPYDAGMPTILHVSDRTGNAKSGAAGTVTGLYDHHAVVTNARGLTVTDVVELGISHPCGAFDRWSHFMVAGAPGDPVEVWQTEFSRSQPLS